MQTTQSPPLLSTVNRQDFGSQSSASHDHDAFMPPPSLSPDEIGPVKCCISMKIVQPSQRQRQRSRRRGSWLHPACRSVAIDASVNGSYLAWSSSMSTSMSMSIVAQTHLPLGKSKFLVSSALGRQSLVVLQASAHDAACDGQVAVVTATRDFPSSVFQLKRPPPANRPSLPLVSAAGWEGLTKCLRLSTRTTS